MICVQTKRLMRRLRNVLGLPVLPVRTLASILFGMVGAAGVILMTKRPQDAFVWPMRAAHISGLDI